MLYLSYYGLNKEPFHITPDPDFLFESPSHREAYATIAYGVARRKGFVAITGEVGTGKTTVLRAYLNSLDAAQIQTVYIYNPDLSFDELLRTLLTELGEEPGDETTDGILRKIQFKLISLFEQNRTLLLVVDEAQNMPIDTLEKLRMLSNLETSKDKLIQIVLVGQPELDEKLNLYKLRQLKQRIAVRAALRPLTAGESVEYIRHRFEYAGGQFEGILEASALRKLVRHAHGSPRSLNILCDNVLLAGFGADQRPIGAALVHEVAYDMGGLVKPRFGRRERIAAAAMLILTLAGIALGNWQANAAYLRGGSSPANVANTGTTEAEKPTPPAVDAALAQDTKAVIAEQPQAVAEIRGTTTAPKLDAPVAVAAEPVKAPEASVAKPPRARTRKAPAGAGEMEYWVKPGENLTRLLLAHYGRNDDAVLLAVQARNPDIQNINMILKGQKLIFPIVEGVAPQVGGLLETQEARTTHDQDL